MFKRLKKFFSNSQTPSVTAKREEFGRFHDSVPHHVIATEFTRGLGRRIPLADENSFSGVITFRYLSISTTLKSPRNISTVQSVQSQQQQANLLQPRNKGDGKISETTMDAEFDFNSFGGKFKGIEELEEPTRSLLIKDICQPLDIYEIIESKKNN